MMTQPATAHGNRTKREQLDRIWQSLLDQVQRRGFHGSAAIEVNVSDGIIQHICRKVEQREK